MAKNQRTKDQMLRDRAAIARLYLHGETQQRIAQLISEERDYTITRTTVSRDLKAVRQEWMESSLIDFQEAQAIELAKIDEVEAQAWAAFERSMKPTTTVQKSETGERQVVDGEGVLRNVPDKVVTRKKSVQKVGDPRWLAIIDRCIERRCKIRGFEAAKKLELTGKGGEALVPQGAVTGIIIHSPYVDPSAYPKALPPASSDSDGDS